MERLDIDSIKDAVYEFEGLLELAALREDKMKDLLPLLKGKLDVINTFFSGVNYPEQWEEEDDEEVDDIDIISPYGSMMDEDDPVENLEETNKVDRVEKGDKAQEVEETLISETTRLQEEDDNKQEEENNEEKPDEASESDIAPKQESAVNKEEPEKEEPESEPLYVFEENEESPEDINVKANQRESTPAAHANVTVGSKNSGSNASGKPAFCVNDRFRFRRELFKNSDSEFNYAMNLVATMDGYDEAEEYFIGELGWDFEKPDVIDFMAIIRNYFEK